MRKTYVFGHKRPDTDSVCGAISLSYLKNKMGLNTEPRILGEINAETAFVLKKFNIKVPKYLNDTKTQLKDVKFQSFYVNEHDSIYSVYNFMHANQLTGIPIVDNAGIFKGYVSLREIANELVTHRECKLNTKLSNLKETLNASESLDFNDNIIGIPVLANIPFRMFINTIELNKDTIMILANTEYILDYAIESKVKLIIVTNNIQLNKYQIKLAKNNRVNIIITPYDIYKTVRSILLANPIRLIKRANSIVCFGPFDYLSDFMEISNKLKHTNYPIVNGKGICEGMLRVIDTSEFERKKVILVDHNEIHQSVDGLNEAEIIEVVDHHNIGNINTNIPINFRNMTVGSVNTIIYKLFMEQKIRIPKNIAGAMLSGIISDTLLLASPTTTEEDRQAAKMLTKIAGLDLNEYGLELLKSGVSIEGLSISDVIYRDFKSYSVGEIKIGVAQMFTTTFKDYERKLQGYVNKLNEISTNDDYKVACLVVTDIINNSSYIIFNPNAKKHLEEAFSINEIYQGYLLDHVVSRKKQIVPLIMQVFEKQAN